MLGISDTTCEKIRHQYRICLLEGLKDKPITEDDIKEYFSQYGNITDCVLMKDKATGVSFKFSESLSVS